MNAFFITIIFIFLRQIQAVDLGEEAKSPTADPDIIIDISDTGMTGERNVTSSTNLNDINTPCGPGDDIPLRIDFDGQAVSGATKSGLNGDWRHNQSFSISSDMIDITIRPDDLTGRHKNIVIDLAQNAITQNNEATRITIDFGTQRSREKAAGMVLFSCDVTAGTPTLTIIEKWDFVSHSGCNLIVHDGAVHYTEQPIAASRFKPINSSL